MTGPSPAGADDEPGGVGAATEDIPADEAPSVIGYSVDAESGAVRPAGAVNGFDVLATVASLPVSTWRYEWEPPGVRHLGPMAQDWHAAFGLGDDETRIPVVDGQGVALVAIQALHRELGELRGEVERLRAELHRARGGPQATAVPPTTSTREREAPAAPTSPSPSTPPKPVPVTLSGALTEAVLLSGAAVPSLRRVLEAQPTAALARAVLTLMVGADHTDERLREELVRAHADAAPGRERSLVRTVFLHTHRHYDQAADQVVAHLAAYPGDPLATLLVSAFTLAEGRGHRGYHRHREAVIDAQLAAVGSGGAASWGFDRPATSVWWPWAAMAGAARAEQGRTQDAMVLAEQALEMAPRAGVAAHARAHALHELGAGAEAVAWLDEWMAPDPGLVQRRHLQWHAALQALAAGDLDDARRRADRELAADDVGMRSAVNWRLLLVGEPTAQRVDAEHAGALLEQPGGMVEVFDTFQLALALAVAGDHGALRALAGRARRDDRENYQHVLAPVADAFADVLTGQPGAAVERLEPLGDRLEHLGGVRVEREIVQDTLARALVEAGRPARAAELLHDRTAHRHGHTYEHRLLSPDRSAQ